jgi:hypothetical protein
MSAAFMASSIKVKEERCLRCSGTLDNVSWKSVAVWYGWMECESCATMESASCNVTGKRHDKDMKTVVYSIVHDHRYYYDSFTPSKMLSIRRPHSRTDRTQHLAAQDVPLERKSHRCAWPLAEQGVTEQTEKGSCFA